MTMKTKPLFYFRLKSFGSQRRFASKPPMYPPWPLLIAVLAICTVPACGQSRDGATVLSNKFFTKGHVKAKGLDISIKYPHSWTAAEGDRANVVQKFTKPEVDAALIIVALKIPGPPLSNADKTRLFASKELVTSNMPAAAKQGFHKATTMENEPAALLEYTETQDRAGQSLTNRCMSLVFIRGEISVAVMASVAGRTEDADAIEREFRATRPIFQAMLNSIVFEDKWKQ